LKKTVVLAVQAAVFVALAVSMASAGENVLYNFPAGDGCAPYGSLISDPAGNFYGTTYGDREHFGTVYQLTLGSGGAYTQTVLHTFLGGADGRNPVVGLVRDQAGNLYGTVQLAGGGSAGTVFEMTPASNGTWTESTIYTFTGGTDGAVPLSPLIMDAAGNLYGTTSQGGSTGNGVIYELSPNSGGWTETVLYNFNGGDDGSAPAGTLLFDNAGSLYGTASGGGADGAGTVFKLAPANGAWNFSLLYTLTGGDDGSDPEGGLARDRNGVLYGTANGGGSGLSGTVFQVRPSISALPGISAPWMARVLYAFSSGDDGGNPDTGVTVDQAGNLNGTSESGGAGGFGVVFRMTPGSTGWSQSVLYSFSGGADGGFPESRVMMDGAGNIYGTTVSGGASQCGVAYQITP
jgi:uncharacterized repeat protein (TIGR03803 family)